jgi:rhodanese-related sulfurtransferase
MKKIIWKILSKTLNKRDNYVAVQLLQARFGYLAVNIMCRSLLPWLLPLLLLTGSWSSKATALTVPRRLSQRFAGGVSSTESSMDSLRVQSASSIPWSYNSWALSMAIGPGVIVAPAADIRAALQNPATTVIDARTLEELQANGYFTGCEAGSGQTKCRRWVHAPTTANPPASPLLSLASASILPDMNAPIIVHCGSGIRASVVKTILEDLGYTNVMNAGGLTDLEFTMAGQ